MVQFLMLIIIIIYILVNCVFLINKLHKLIKNNNIMFKKNYKYPLAVGRNKKKNYTKDINDLFYKIVNKVLNDPDI